MFESHIVHLNPNLFISTQNFLPSMNLSTSSPKSNTSGNKSIFCNDSQSSVSLYDSALDNLTQYSSFNESANNNEPNTTKNSNNSSPNNKTTDFDATLNANSSLSASISASMMVIQSESTDSNNSQSDVDPKSQLANKTIFKSDNPDLSIIEINDCTIEVEEQELKDSIVVIEDTADDNRKCPQHVSSPRKSVAVNTEQPTTPTPTVTLAADKRRKKPEALYHSSRQKLNVAIAEASAAESAGGENKQNIPQIPGQPATKREIKIYDTVTEFEDNLPPTVTVLNTPFGSKVYLVGTAHFSEESQDDVSYVIRNVRPDIVMVELCPARIHILKLDEKTLLEEAKSFNTSKIRGIIQTHGFVNGIFFILLLQMSAQIAKDLGMAPGGEFRRAFEEVHNVPGCILHLGDRPIRITLHRALRALSWWQTIKMVWRLTSNDTISIQEVEECKQRDLLEKLMQEMAGEFPAFSDVFVKERDMFLCHSLQVASLPQQNADGNFPRPVRVVGVVGIGHAKGIAKMFGTVDPNKIPAIMEIPPVSRGTRIVQYTVKYGVIALTLFGTYKLLRPRLVRLF